MNRTKRFINSLQTVDTNLIAVAMLIENISFLYFAKRIFYTIFLYDIRVRKCYEIVENIKMTKFQMFMQICTFLNTINGMTTIRICFKIL